MPIMGLTNTGRYKAIKDVLDPQRSIPLVRNQNGVVFEKRTVETALPVTFKTNGTSPDNYQLLGRCKVSGEKHVYLSEPLRGIGEYKDILDLSTGAVTRRIKKLVLTGEENILLTGGGCFYFPDVKDYTSTESLICVCTHYTAVVNRSNAPMDDHVVTFCTNNNYIRMYISDYGTALDDFKSYLSSQYAAGTPVTVYYVLASPTTETITVPSGLSGTIEGYCTQDGTPTPDSPIEIKSNGIELVNGKHSVVVKRSQNAPATVQMVGERTGNLFSSEWEVGGIYLNGANDSTTNKIRTVGYIKVEPNRPYSMSRNTFNSFINIRGYDVNKNFVGIGSDILNIISGKSAGNPMAGGDAFCCFTVTDSRVNYLRFNDLSVQTTTAAKNMRYMLVAGEYTEGTMPDYEPYGFKTTITQNGEEKTIYFGSEQLCDIPDTVGDYRDVLDYKTQTLTRWIKSMTLDGAEAFEKVGSGDTAYFRYEIGERGYARSLGVLCTHFKTAAVTSSTTDIAINVTNSSSTGKQYICIRPDNADTTTLADFLSFLSAQSQNGTPVRVWYALTEPETSTVDIPKLTTTQSISKFTVGTTLSPFETTVKTSTAVTPYTGTSEVMFCSDRTKIGYSVAGNSQQSGTPAPDSPIQPEFVGERTGNLFPKDSLVGKSSIVRDAFNEASSSIVFNNGQYTLSMNVTTEPATGIFKLCFTYTDNSQDKTPWITKNTPSVVLVSDANKVVKSISITDYNNYTDIVLSNIMLNFGSTPLPYEPYGFKIPLTCDSTTKNVYLSEPLAKIGDYADILDYATQTVTRRIKKLVLTGEESWSRDSSTGVFNRALENRLVANFQTGLCSHYPFEENRSMYNRLGEGHGCVSANENPYYGLWIRDNNFSSVSDFKAYLSTQYQNGTPVTVWYVLAEPTTEQIEAPDFTPSVTDITTYSSTVNFKPTTKFTGQIRPAVFGFHVDPSIADPYNAVTYICDAEGLAPAKMGGTTFDYGSWKDVFFMPRPCMLNFDGTVAYYLDPDDYTKRADGTASDISDPTFNGNAMMEWPKIWWKFVATNTLGEGYFYVANEKLDDEFRCWSSIDADGEETDCFYTAIFNSTLHDGKFRSLSGYALTSANGSGGTTVDQEIAYCEANNSGGRHDWYTAVWSDRMLINALLVLMGKSLDTQAVFGRGLDTGDQAAKEAFVTGSLNQNGLFYGDASAGSNAVKVFGMENWWGCCWSRTAGCVLSDGDFRVKPYYPYNTSGVGYYTLGTDPKLNGVVTKMRYTPYGMKPAETTSATTAIGYSDNYYKNASGDRYLGVGGRAGGDSACGAFSFALNFTATHTSWYFSTTLSCKPEVK